MEELEAQTAREVYEDELRQEEFVERLRCGGGPGKIEWKMDRIGRRVREDLNRTWKQKNEQLVLSGSETKSKTRRTDAAKFSPFPVLFAAVGIAAVAFGRQFNLATVDETFWSCLKLLCESMNNEPRFSRTRFPRCYFLPFSPGRKRRSE